MGLLDRFRKLDQGLVNACADYQLLYELGAIINRVEQKVGRQLPRSSWGRLMNPYTLEGWLRDCPEAQPDRIADVLGTWRNAGDYQSKLAYLSARIEKFDALARIVSREKSVLGIVTDALGTLTVGPIAGILRTLDENGRQDVSDESMAEMQTHEQALTALAEVLYWIGEQKGVMDAMPPLNAMLGDVMSAGGVAVDDLRRQVRELM